MNNHTSSLEFSHFPVMLSEVIKFHPFKGDCTFWWRKISQKHFAIDRTFMTSIAKKLGKIPEPI